MWPRAIDWWPTKRNQYSQADTVYLCCGVAVSWLQSDFHMRPVGPAPVVLALGLVCLVDFYDGHRSLVDPGLLCPTSLSILPRRTHLCRAAAALDNLLDKLPPQRPHGTTGGCRIMTKTAAEWAIAMLEDVVLDVLRAEHWHRRNISEIAREAGLVCPTVPVRWQDGITREILYRLEAKGLVIGGGWWGATPDHQTQAGC